MLRTLLAVLAALWLTAAGAAETVFYQPQNRDASVTPEQWQQLFRSLRQEGTHTLVVQWSRYGNENFGGQGGWLDKTLQTAMVEGLDLVLGLYWDPAFFNWNRDPGPGLGPFLSAYVRNTLATAWQWRHLHGASRLRGWYVPAELDDLNWQSGEKRTLLAETLGKITAGLADYGARPLAISAFFGGHMPPGDYAAWLKELSGRGWQIWVQDGSGTGQLSPDQRQAYLQALFACPEGTGLSLVVEAFRQTSGPGEGFKARPATPEELQAALDSYQGQCQAARAVFSLRYLPLSRGILAYE